ncbi:hypothetical protein EON77_14880, partial [bacterium]
MKLSIHPKTFFVASGVVAVLGAGAMYFAYTGLGEMDSKVASLRKEARDTKEVQAQLEKTGVTIEGLRKKLDHLEEGVPSFAYIPTMTRELESAGRSRGIEVLGIRPVPAPPKKDGEKADRQPYQEFTIQVKGRGSYGSVMRFVQALTKFPKIVEVRMLTLSPKIDSATPLASPKLDADIELRAYAFKDDAPAVSAERIEAEAGASKSGVHKGAPAKGGKAAPGKASPEKVAMRRSGAAT